MTDKEKLLKLRKLADAMYYAAQHLTTDASRLHKAMDEYHQFIINEYHKKEPTIPDIVDEHFYEMLEEEPVSEELEEAADNALSDVLNTHEIVNVRSCLEMFRFGAKWQKSSLWKHADGDDLPEIDREVIALLDNGKVVFAHRPPEYWDGKDIVTGKVTRNYPKTYDKGGWNIPNIKYWLDVELPKEIEL